MLPARVLVNALDRLPSSALDALCSIAELVWAERPACRRAEPARDFWSALALLLPNALPALDATRDDVCFGFTAI
jgi:hypothetical protein